MAVASGGASPGVGLGLQVLNADNRGGGRYFRHRVAGSARARQQNHSSDVPGKVSRRENLPGRGAGAQRSSVGLSQLAAHEPAAGRPGHCSGQPQFGVARQVAGDLVAIRTSCTACHVSAIARADVCGGPSALGRVREGASCVVVACVRARRAYVLGLGAACGSGTQCGSRCHVVVCAARSPLRGTGLGEEPRRASVRRVWLGVLVGMPSARQGCGLCRGGVPARGVGVYGDSSVFCRRRACGRGAGDGPRPARADGEGLGTGCGRSCIRSVADARTGAKRGPTQHAYRGPYHKRSDRVGGCRPLQLDGAGAAQSMHRRRGRCRCVHRPGMGLGRGGRAGRLRAGSRSQGLWRSVAVGAACAAGVPARARPARGRAPSAPMHGWRGPVHWVLAATILYAPTIPRGSGSGASGLVCDGQSVRVAALRVGG